MLIIGLTGPSGAGKGEIASLFARFGVPSIDTDRVYREILVPPSVCLDELVNRFGRGILAPNGSLDRRVLSELVFSGDDKQALGHLNRIAHRHILDEVRRRLMVYEREGVSAVLVDAPQLFESGFDRECDKILSVLAPYDTRLARILSRDGIDVSHAEARMRAQPADEVFCARSDAVIRNDATLEAAMTDVRRLLEEWEVPYEE